jgi:DNA polymerase
MSDYLRVLEGTEQHLRALKASGVRFLNIASETLDSLTESSPSINRNTTKTNGQAERNGSPSTDRVLPAIPAIPQEIQHSRINPQAQESVVSGERDVSAVAAMPAAPEAHVILSYDSVAPIDKSGERIGELPRKTIEQPSENGASVTLSYDSIQLASAMDELRQRASACLKCPHLVNSRKNVVFGVGDIHARLMFVGEAPGADEDARGEPFVGAAGQLLTRIIQTMGLSREAVYIANILKCRPDTPGQSFGNRKPTPDEMKTCLPYLLAQIDLIRPGVMVALGSTAVEGLLGKCESIGKMRGKFHTFREIPLMPTFHPAYLLRNQALTEKRKVWEDMLQVMTRLEMPISEKQKSYFLKQ